MEGFKQTIAELSDSDEDQVVKAEFAVKKRQSSTSSSAIVDLTSET
jgi:hypothetical protein